MAIRIPALRAPAFSFFARTFAFQLIPAVALTLILNGLLYTALREAAEREVERHAVRAVRQTMLAVEDRFIDPVLSVPRVHFSELPFNEDLFHPIRFRDRREPLRILAVARRLEFIKTSLPLPASVDLFYRNDSLLFLDGAYRDIPPDSRPDQLPPPLRMADGPRAARSNAPSWVVYEREDPNGREEFVAAVWSLPAAGSVTEAYLAVSIPKDAVAAYLRRLSGVDAGSLSIVSAEGIPLARIGREEAIGPEGVPATDSGARRIRAGSGEAILAWERNASTGWFFLSVSPLESYRSSYLRFRWTFSLILIGALAAAAAGTFSATRVSQRPLSRLARSLAGDADGKSAQDDLELLRATFRSMERAVGSLNERMREDRAYVEEHYARGLLAGTIPSFPGSGALACAVMVAIEFPGELGLEARVVTAAEVAARLSADPALSFTGFGDERRGVTGILRLESEGDWEAASRRLAQGIGAVIASGFTVCAGRPRTPDRLPDSREEAERCLAERFFAPRRDLLLFDPDRVGDRQTMPGYGKALAAVEAALRAREPERAVDGMRRILDRMKEQRFDPRRKLIALSDAVAAFERVFWEFSIDPTACLGYGLREKFRSDVPDVDRCLEWMRELADAFRTEVEGRLPGRSGRLTRERLEGLFAPGRLPSLSLKAAADELGVGPTHLSRVFRDLVGEGFSEYLQRRKLEVGRGFLETTGMSVKEISAALGYGSVQHFIKRFRERYGPTPSGFRADLRKKAASDKCHPQGNGIDSKE